MRQNYVGSIGKCHYTNLQDATQRRGSLSIFLLSSFFLSVCLCRGTAQECQRALLPQEPWCGCLNPMFVYCASTEVGTHNSKERDWTVPISALAFPKERMAPAVWHLCCPKGSLMVLGTPVNSHPWGKLCMRQQWWEALGPGDLPLLLKSS